MPSHAGSTMGSVIVGTRPAGGRTAVARRADPRARRAPRAPRSAGAAQGPAPAHRTRGSRPAPARVAAQSFTRRSQPSARLPRISRVIPPRPIEAGMTSVPGTHARTRPRARSPPWRARRAGGPDSLGRPGAGRSAGRARTPRRAPRGRRPRPPTPRVAPPPRARRLRGHPRHRGVAMGVALPPGPGRAEHVLQAAPPRPPPQQLVARSCEATRAAGSPGRRGADAVGHGVTVVASTAPT